MASMVHSITVDCANPLKLAQFWAATLEYSMEDWSDDDGAMVVDPTGKGTQMLFLPVPEGKITKNRVHLDLMPRTDMATEVERLMGLGAKRIKLFEENGGKWTVMHDPEGNEFCVERSAIERQSQS